MADQLTNLATKVEGDPFFVSGLLAAFAGSERLDDAGLAEHLGCRLEDLPILKLCRAPRDDPAAFRADADALATRFDLDAARLIDAVRCGRVILRQRGAGPLFLAARDRGEGGGP